MENNRFITKTNSETQKVGENFVSRLVGGDIICLNGNLGSGKTTFVQGIARGLGISSRILSPTFVIVREYEIPVEKQKSDIKRLYHLDLYRLKEEHEVLGIDLKSLLEDKHAIVCIEWPDLAVNILPTTSWNIFLEYNESGREILIKKKSYESN